jgi:DNA repair exonuclease SbcCD ATPase subunit
MDEMNTSVCQEPLRELLQYMETSVDKLAGFVSKVPVSAQAELREILQDIRLKSKVLVGLAGFRVNQLELDLEVSRAFRKATHAALESRIKLGKRRRDYRSEMNEQSKRIKTLAGEMDKLMTQMANVAGICDRIAEDANEVTDETDTLDKACVDILEKEGHRLMVGDDERCLLCGCAARGDHGQDQDQGPGDHHAETGEQEPAPSVPERSGKHEAEM